MGIMDDILQEEEGVTEVGQQTEDTSETQGNTEKEEEQEQGEESSEEEDEAEKQEDSEESEEEVSSEEEDEKQEQKEETEGEINFKTLSEQLGHDVESVDDLKTRLSTASESGKKVEELQGQLSETTKKYQELEQKYKQELNPLSYFANENEYKRQVLLKKHPELDPSVLSKVVSSDIEKLSPLDAIKLNMQIQDADIYRNEKEVIEAIEDEFQIEELSEKTLDEIPSLERNKILKKAKEAKKYFKTLQDGIELPKEVDTEAIQKEKQQKAETIKENWKPWLQNELPKELKEIKISKTVEGKENVLHTFDIDKKFVDQIISNVENTASLLGEKGSEFSDKNKAELVKSVRDLYILNNLHSIVKSHAEEVVTNMSEEEFKKYNHPRPVNKAKGAKKKTSKEEQHESADREIENSLP